MYEGASVTLHQGAKDLEVVGESYRQDALWKIVGRTGERVRQPVHGLLVAEIGNEHDANAVAVWILGEHVGYLSRSDAAVMRPGLLALAGRSGKPVALDGVICGGGQRLNGLGMLGVFLQFNPADFGLRSTHIVVEPKMRTGLSLATFRDAADDRYNLDWVMGLSDDSAQRARQLKKVLMDEREQLSRHYAFCELETTLYGMREVASAILDEYDAVCRAHDHEMDAIRPVLLDVFGCVPLLDTYRQMAIRQAKAQNHGEAARWCRRGLELYGEDAEDTEAVLALQKRLVNLENRPSRPVRTTRPQVAQTSPRQVEDPYPASAGAIESLTCLGCGSVFTRTVTRGRKPHHCPSCRSGNGLGSRP